MRLLLSIGSVALVSLTAIAAQQSAQPTFRSTARLVPISVVVSDRAGRSIEGLTAADFEIRENGKVQAVAAFAVEADDVETHAFSAPSGPNTFTNVLEGRAGSGATILLYDPLNTKDVDQRRALDHIIALLKELGPDERIGFYVLKSDGLLVVHDFTRDAGSLVKALNRYAPANSSELSGSEQKFQRMAADPDPAVEARFEAALQRAEQITQLHHIDRRARATTDALEALVQRLAGVAGRKNVIWVTGSFPLSITLANERKSWSPELHRATRALSHSDVAIYVVHAAGLIAAQQIVPLGAGTPTRPVGSAFPTPLHPEAAALETGQIVAEQTGARLYKNTNDLQGAVQRAIDDARLTYVLGYYPTNDRWDGQFRRVQVKVARRDAVVRHRAGYYAHPPLAVDADYRKNALVESLAYPIEATGVGLAVRVDRSGTQRAALSITVDPQGINLQEQQGRWIGSVDVAIAQRTTQNTFARSLDITVPLNLSADTRTALLREGLTLTRTIDLQPDLRQVIVGVRDATTGAIGTVILDAARLQTHSIVLGSATRRRLRKSRHGCANDSQHARRSVCSILDRPAECGVDR